MQWDVRIREAIAKANGTSYKKQDATVILIDPAARISGPGLPKPDDGAIVSYQQLTTAKQQTLDIYRFATASDAFIKPFLPALEPTQNEIVAVIEFDWLGTTSKWPEQFKRVHDCLQSSLALSRVNIVLAAVNFATIAERTTSSSLNEECDICQQYLRTLAIVHDALLIYESQDIIWSEIFAQVAFGSEGSPTPDSRLEESRLLVWPRTDSKLQIMAVNPTFDYEAASENRLQLPEVNNTPNLENPDTDADDDQIEHIKLEDIIREAQERAKSGDSKPQSVGEGHFDARRFEYSEEEDGKKTISEFFEYLVHKST